MTRAAAPRSLEEAVRLLADDPELIPVAGCTDLMVCEPEDRSDMPAVLDLLGVPELSGIRDTANGLEIGSTTTFTELSRSQRVRDRYPALTEAAGQIGGWQIQNRATLGGNIANASPAGDSLPVLLALDAEILIAGRDGERRLPYSRFHTGYRTTAIDPGELLVAVFLPEPPPASSQIFRKIGTRQALAISKVVIAALAVVVDGEFRTFRLAAGSVAPTPVRLTAVEQVVIGSSADAETADVAARIAAESVEPIDDVRSTAGYRRFALARTVRRAILELAK